MINVSEISLLVGLVGGVLGIIGIVKGWSKESNKLDIQFTELKTIVTGLAKTIKEIKITIDKMSDDVYADIDKLKEDIIILKKDKERIQHALDELKGNIKQ